MYPDPARNPCCATNTWMSSPPTRTRAGALAVVLAVAILGGGCSTPKTASGTLETGKQQVTQLVLDAAHALPATASFTPPTEVGTQPCRKTVLGYVIGRTGAHRAEVPLIVTVKPGTGSRVARRARRGVGEGGLRRRPVSCRRERLPADPRADARRQHGRRDRVHPTRGSAAHQPVRGVTLPCRWRFDPRPSSARAALNTDRASGSPLSGPMALRPSALQRARRAEHRPALGISTVRADGASTLGPPARRAPR